MNLNTDYVKKLMGWCPACKKIESEKEQTFCFANRAAVSDRIGNYQDIQTSNVIFPANNSLFCLLFAAGFNLLLRFEDLQPFLAGLVLLNAVYCLFVIKVLSAGILVDSRGVHLQAFRMRNFEIPYEEIEAVGEYKLEKRSKKNSRLLYMLGVIALCGIAYVALAGEWRAFVLIISTLPLSLCLEKKRKSQYRDLDTRLYIKTRNKKWYEWTPYYSIITDEASAARLKSFIERNSGRK
ncbi:DUF1673 family protein [Methanosarcina sp. KYL-1]|uniref:hypothetical protein n=1 Tax=Methanosarcina sp. KYL-1 TaxID=2602068 RepID=UPI002100940E|nr:hypothetical protein [Methanosarcina sp. KYL-1]MCQ1535059.1 DUF1673 family protein [Methanosarcina sp. KYL-1]